MPGKAFDQPVGIELQEALVFQSGRQRVYAFMAPQRYRTDQAAENDPIGRTILAGARRPGEPPAANQAAVDMDCVGPAEGDGAAGRGMCRKGISKSVQSDIDGAAGQPERFIRLEYRGKFDHIEATDIDKRPGTLIGSHALGLDERLADFPELDQPKWGRKVYCDLQCSPTTGHTTTYRSNRIRALSLVSL